MDFFTTIPAYHTELFVLALLFFLPAGLFCLKLAEFFFGKFATGWHAYVWQSTIVCLAMTASAAISSGLVIPLPSPPTLIQDPAVEIGRLQDLLRKRGDELEAAKAQITQQELKIEELSRTASPSGTRHRQGKVEVKKGKKEERLYEVSKDDEPSQGSVLPFTLNHEHLSGFEGRLQQFSEQLDGDINSNTKQSLLTMAESLVQYIDLLERNVDRRSESFTLLEGYRPLLAGVQAQIRRVGDRQVPNAHDVGKGENQ